MPDPLHSPRQRTPNHSHPLNIIQKSTSSHSQIHFHHTHARAHLQVRRSSGINGGIMQARGHLSPYLGASENIRAPRIPYRRDAPWNRKPAPPAASRSAGHHIPTARRPRARGLCCCVSRIVVVHCTCAHLYSLHFFSFFPRPGAFDATIGPLLRVCWGFDLLVASGADLWCRFGDDPRLGWNFGFFGYIF